MLQKRLPVMKLPVGKQVAGKAGAGAPALLLPPAFCRRGTRRSQRSITPTKSMSITRS
jgi:hypothetical protein